MTIAKTGIKRRRRGKRATVWHAYLRVSTEQQGDSGAGLAAQRAQIEAEAARRGIEIPPECWHVDVYSGGSMDKRDGLMAALLALEAGKGAGLMAANVSRVARNTVDYLNLRATADAQGWQLSCLDLPQHLDLGMDELLSTLLAAFAQFERKLIGKRTSDALRAKQAQGVRLGRPRVLDMGTVALACSLARTYGYNAAGRMLTEQGVPTARGGVTWHASAVRAVVHSQDAQALRIDVAK